MTEQLTTQEWLERIFAEEPALRDYHEALQAEPFASLNELRGTFGPMQADRNGEPISYADWAILFSSMEYRRIAYDEVGPWHISTVWLGLSGIPGYIFESMVFQNELTHRESDLFGGYDFNESVDERRYGSEEDARAGHAELVRQAEAMLQVNEAIDPRAGG